MKIEHVRRLTLHGAEDLLSRLEQKLKADDDLFDGEESWQEAIGYSHDQDSNARDNLESLIEALDDMECEYGDFFGTEGWRHRYDF